MKTEPLSQFLIQWKGNRSGPFTLAQIREKLVGGELSRMHQVQINGAWISLDEFITGHDSEQREVARKAAANSRAREDQLRKEYEAHLASERVQQQILLDQLTEAENRAAHLAAPPPAPQNVSSFPYEPSGGPNYSSANTPRTSPLAITAFVCALCNFVPFLNFISWIGALVLGHVALNDMRQNPALMGRGLAVAALCITYFLLILGLTFGILMALNGGIRF